MRCPGMFVSCRVKGHETYRIYSVNALHFMLLVQHEAHPRAYQIGKALLAVLACRVAWPRVLNNDVFAPWIIVVWRTPLEFRGHRMKVRVIRQASWESRRERLQATVAVEMSRPVLRDALTDACQHKVRLIAPSGSTIPSTVWQIVRQDGRTPETHIVELASNSALHP